MIPDQILNTVFSGILLFLHKIMTIYTQERYLKMNMT